MKRLLIGYASVVLTCLWTPLLVQAVPIPVFTVGSAAVTQGSTFNIPVTVTNAVNLTSWQFDLKYEPTVLRANLVSEGPFLSSAGTTFFTPGVIDHTTGYISLVSASYVGLPPGPSGHGQLANIEFSALKPGTSPLTPSNVFLDFRDSGFTVTEKTGVNVGPGAVPIPDTLGLALLGSVLLWGVLRWQQREGRVR